MGTTKKSERQGSSTGHIVSRVGTNSRLRNLVQVIPAPVRSLLNQLRIQASEDRVSGLAAETAFFVVLSVFPGLLVLAAALGSLDLFLGEDVATEAQDVVVDFLRRILTDRASGAIDVVQDLFEEQRGGIVTVSLLVSFWSLTRGFTAVIRALNLAYDLEEGRPWIRQRLIAALLSLGSVVVGALVLAAFVSGPLLGGGRALADAFGVGATFARVWSLLRWPIAFSLIVLWAALIYYFGPSRADRLRKEIPGAALTAVFGIVASAGLNLYLRFAGDANPVLGSLGGGLILLVWLYLLSLGLLIGGELNALLRSRRRKQAERPVP